MFAKKIALCLYYIKSQIAGIFSYKIHDETHSAFRKSYSNFNSLTPQTPTKLMLSWLNPSKLVPVLLKQNSFSSHLYLFSAHRASFLVCKQCINQYLLSRLSIKCTTCTLNIMLQMFKIPKEQYQAQYDALTCNMIIKSHRMYY